MVKLLMGRIYLQFYPENFCLSKPVNEECGASVEKHVKFNLEVRGLLNLDWSEALKCVVFLNKMLNSLPSIQEIIQT